MKVEERLSEKGKGFGGREEQKRVIEMIKECYVHM